MLEFKLEFNIYQELFLVVFSILYGVILQSLSEFQPFPWGKIFSKKKLFRCNKEFKICKIALCRMFLSILILNVGPFSTFAHILFLLGKFKIYRWCLMQYWLELLITIWCSFIGFSFYRLYHSLAVTSPFRIAFIDREEELRYRVHPDYRGHLFSAGIYALGYLSLILYQFLPNYFVLVIVLTGGILIGVFLYLTSRCQNVHTH